MNGGKLLFWARRTNHPFFPYVHQRWVSPSAAVIYHAAIDPNQPLVDWRPHQNFSLTSVQNGCFSHRSPENILVTNILSRDFSSHRLLTKTVQHDRTKRYRDLPTLIVRSSPFLISHCYDKATWGTVVDICIAGIRGSNST